MERIARFEKVSESLFVSELAKVLAKTREANQKCAREIYNSIMLPKRATQGSAGYDIYVPFPILLGPGESMIIPTGIRVRMKNNWCLFILPRSGLGSRFRFQLNNTMGVIDSDYYYSANEGQILVPMINDSRENKNVELAAGTAFVQGIFVRYGITEDDDTVSERNGGFGSTG